MTAALDSAIVRICDVDGRIVGAGFLAGQLQVFTCAHVVASALRLPEGTPQPPQAEVQLDFPLAAAGRTLAARIVHWQPVDDVARLELTSDPPEGAHPVCLVTADDLWNHDFRAFGFPTGHPDGIYASGVLRGRTAAGWVQIVDVNQTGYFVAPGFSGTPVWDEQMNGVVGMIVAADLQPGVRAAFIIPACVLIAAGGPDCNPFVGAEAIRRIFETCDHSQVFVGPYERLRDAYIKPWTVFERVRLDRFTGREWLTARVDAFLQKNDQRYLILEASAGLGKTAFLAHLAKERGYIHHFVEKAPGPEGISRGLKNLAAQLVLAWKLDPCLAAIALPDVASQPDFLYSLLVEAAKKRDKVKPDEKIVLVVDALDEAGTPYGQNVLGLPRVPPERVYFVVSQRPVRVPLMVEEPHCVLPLEATGERNLADMRVYLETAATWSGIKEAIAQGVFTAGQFVETLLKKSQGVWVYLHYAVSEIDRSRGRAFELDKLPDGIVQYYADYWRRWRDRHKDAWHSLHLPLLAALAAWREAMTLQQLMDCSGVDCREGEVYELLEESWRPFVAVTTTDHQTLYQFYHPTLGEFFEGRVDRSNLTKGDQTFVDALRRATHQARLRIIGAMHEQMMSAPIPGARHNAARQLTRLRWLADVEAVASDVTFAQIIAYLEIVTRYIRSSAEAVPIVSAERLYLTEGLTRVLEAGQVDWSERQRVCLLVFRAALWGQLGELGKAGSDYAVARESVERLAKAPNQSPEDHRLFTRVFLGAANVARQEALQTAVDLYHKATEFSGYGGDVILEVEVYTELSYAYALLKRWTEAERYYQKALEILETKRVEDRLAYANCRALVLDNASLTHWEKAQSLPASALAEYVKAHELVQQEIALLQEHFGESESLILAHINCGDYLLALSEFRDNPIGDPLAEACKEWRTAADLAHRLGLVALKREADARLEQHCLDRRVR